MIADGVNSGIARQPNVTARNKILPLAATVVALTLQAPTAASVKTQEWKNIAGATVASVDKDGIFAGTWQGTSISTTYTDAKVKTVAGTANRITIGGTATDPTFDIAATYVGQNTITTLGTIGTGVWQGTAVADAYIASAAAWNAKEPAIAAGTTAQYWRGDKSWQTLDKAAVGLSNVENTALSTWAGSANLTTLGTIGTGTWNATAIADGKIAAALTGKTYNALTLTALATGFTIAGGTVSKTLTVPLDASVSGTNTGDQTSVSGNAGTATALQTARNINGVSFNGTADITVTAAAGTLSGATLAAGVTASSLTSVGTLTSLTVAGTVALTGNASETFDGTNATRSFIQVQVGTVSRWLIVLSGDAESGSNAGSYLEIKARSDAGGAIDTAVQIVRAAGGLITTTRPVSITSSTDSTSITTGSLITAGGIGVGKRLTLDGGTGKTLRIVNAVANALVAVALGGVGPTGSTAGNPQGWMRIDIAGTDRYIPFW